jgi:uncharacterized protein (TIGR02145 family)
MKKIKVFCRIISICLIIACNKDAEIPTVENVKIKQITSHGAVIISKIENDGGAQITSRGICWSTINKPTTDGDKLIVEADSLEFTSKITNLMPGTMYYARAYAINKAGTGYGNSVYFTTSGSVPQILDKQSFVRTVSFDSVYIFVSFYPQSLPTSISIEYGESTSYGSVYTVSQNPVNGYENEYIMTGLHGLNPHTTYHCRIKAENEMGTTYGKDMVFTTFGAVPEIYDDDYYSIKKGLRSVSISLGINTGAMPTTVYVEWGTTTDYGNTTMAQPNPLLPGVSSQPIINITGLTPATVYHFRAKATNGLGTVTGPDKTFSTLGGVPLVVINSPCDVQTRSLVLNGEVYPRNLSTTVIFEWGTTATCENAVTAAESPLSGSEWQKVSALISGLTPGALYYYRIRASNEVGTAYTSLTEFRPLGGLPIMYSVSAIADVNSATINGSVNPNELLTTVTIEWGTGLSFENTISPSTSPISGNSAVNLSVELAGLDPETIYYYRIKAQNELGISYSRVEYFETFSAKDADNNFYRSVNIGTQTWLTENLKTSKYNNGDFIGTTAPLSKDISSESDPKYQWPAESSEANVALYGRLYTWYVVTDSRKICPDGWHVPTNDEMTVLSNYAGGPAHAGGYLKESGTVHWRTPNDGATNSYHFNSLPAGGRTIDGHYNGLTDITDYWTITESDLAKSWSWNLMYISPYFTNQKTDKKYGASVRCLKD